MNAINLGKCELLWDSRRLWINNKDGAVLRLRCDNLKVHLNCINSTPHSDIDVRGDIALCVPPKKRSKK